MLDDIETSIDECANALAAAMFNVQLAAKTLAKACNTHGDSVVLEALKNRMRGRMTLKFLVRLLRLGRGEVVEDVVMGNIPHVAWVENLPASAQAKVIAEGVKFPAHDGSHRIVTLANMSFPEAKAAFQGRDVASVEVIAERMARWNDRMEMRKDDCKRNMRREQRRATARIEELIAPFHGVFTRRNNEINIIFPSPVMLSGEILVELGREVGRVESFSLTRMGRELGDPSLTD